MTENVDTVVLDAGGETFKAGFGGDDAPRALFSSVVAREGGGGRSYVGEEALRKKASLQMRWPLRSGVVTNWEDVERVYHHAFYNELRVAPEEHAVVMAQRNDGRHRERNAQIMFETFNVPALCLASESLLALYASRRDTGVVLQCGSHVADAVAIVQSKIMARCESSVAGTHLTERMTNLIRQRGYSFTEPSEQWIPGSCKEQMCYVALDVEADRATAASSCTLERTYEWLRNRPWGFFLVNAERFECPEALFDPTLAFGPAMRDELMLEWQRVRLLWIGRADASSVFYGMPKGLVLMIQRHCMHKGLFASLRQAERSIGIHTAMHNCIAKCAPEQRKDLYGNLVLCGGSTLFPGIADRLQKELVDWAPSWAKIKIMAPPERKYSVWIGGSILASLDDFLERHCVSMERYEEIGPSCCLADPNVSVREK